MLDAVIIAACRTPIGKFKDAPVRQANRAGDAYTLIAGRNTAYGSGV